MGQRFVQVFCWMLILKKIINIFQKKYGTDRIVRDEIVPGAEWVQKGEGIATRKWDGCACMIQGGKLYKRYDFYKIIILL